MIVCYYLASGGIYAEKQLNVFLFIAYHLLNSIC